MAQNLPYVLVGGTLSKILDKIKSASVPERFTQDFLATKLGFKGGNARAVIPFFKRIGFLGTDGAPTDLYRRFRNPAQSGAAMAQALRTGYAGLYEMNEYVHSASDADLKGLIVQATVLNLTPAWCRRLSRPSKRSRLLLTSRPRLRKNKRKKTLQQQRTRVPRSCHRPHRAIKV